MSRTETKALQQIAFDELASAMPITPAPKAASAKPAAAQRCAMPATH
jgi:hypothetical protein